MSSLISYHAFGDGVSAGLQPRFFREEDETFSQQAIVAGDTVKITAKLVSLINKPLTISISLYDGTDSIESNWKILSIKPNETLTLGPNQSIDFTMEVRSLKAGIYHLHPVFHIEGIGNGLGIGQTVIVSSEHVTAYDLEVDGQRFNMTYLLDKPHSIDKIWLDKEQNSLFMKISSKELVTKNVTLSIWIPNKVIQNAVYSGDSIQHEPLRLRINGEPSAYEYVLIGEDYSIYSIKIPPSSSLSIQMKGTQVIPEFPVNLMVISAIGLIGALVILRMRFNATHKTHDKV